MEPFSIATGAIQVAGAGFQLAKTLYSYLDTARSAQKNIKAIAVEVRLTSSVLEHLGALLEESANEKLCSKNIALDAKSAFRGCEDAFREVDETFNVFLTSQGEATKGVSLSGRLVWPFKKGKLEALQANLERLKTTLLLMLSVLGYAKDRVAKSTVPSTQIAIERLQIQNLIKAKDDATERYESLILEFSQLEAAGASTAKTAFDQPDESPAVGPGAEMTSMMVTFANAPNTQHNSNREAERARSPNANAQDNNAVLLQLHSCSSAVSRLTSTISAASLNVSMGREFDLKDVTESGRSVYGSVMQLAHMVLLNRKYRSGDTIEAQRFTSAQQVTHQRMQQQAQQQAQQQGQEQAARLNSQGASPNESMQAFRERVKAQLERQKHGSFYGIPRHESSVRQEDSEINSAPSRGTSAKRGGWEGREPVMFDRLKPTLDAANPLEEPKQTLVERQRDLMQLEAQRQRSMLVPPPEQQNWQGENLANGPMDDGPNLGFGTHYPSSEVLDDNNDFRLLEHSHEGDESDAEKSLERQRSKDRKDEQNESRRPADTKILVSQESQSQIDPAFKGLALKLETLEKQGAEAVLDNFDFDDFLATSNDLEGFDFSDEHNRSVGGEEEEEEQEEEEEEEEEEAQVAAFPEPSLERRISRGQKAKASASNGPHPSEQPKRRLKRTAALEEREETFDQNLEEGGIKSTRFEEPWHIGSVDDLVRRWTTVEV